MHGKSPAWESGAPVHVLPSFCSPSPSCHAVAWLLEGRNSCSNWAAGSPCPAPAPTQSCPWQGRLSLVCNIPPAPGRLHSGQSGCSVSRGSAGCFPLLPPGAQDISTQCLSPEFHPHGYHAVTTPSKDPLKLAFSDGSVASDTYRALSLGRAHRVPLG